MDRQDSAHVSPTAHYTGYVWYRNGLSHPQLATWRGQLGYRLLRPMDRLGRYLGLELETLLLKRHLLIDAALERALVTYPDLQVVEIACGLSPRGWRWCRRNPHLDYVEADLPTMAQHKARLLGRFMAPEARHLVRALDILAKTGELSLDALFAELDPKRPVWVVTEGFVNYFPTAVVEDFWRRLTSALGRFSAAGYLSDIGPDTAGRRHPWLRLGLEFIARVTRGSVHLHYCDAQALFTALRACGFATARLVGTDADAPDGQFLWVVEARMAELPSITRNNRLLGSP